jgi:hypothetical protein
VAESVPAGAVDAVAEAKAVLLQVFGPGNRGAGGGVTARAADFSRVLPDCSAVAVQQALEVLVEEGTVEVASLPDGVTVYSFSRH